MAELSVLPGRLKGIWIVEPALHGDARGFFMETFHWRKYAEVIPGLERPFVQDNLSMSRFGILRGLHLQSARPQAKLVGVLGGRILDVVVDARRSSPTFGQWEAFELSEENHRQVYIPEGFAHGFRVLSERVYFYYKCSDYYCPSDECGIRWNDPDLAIAWGDGSPLLSERDRSLPRLCELAPERLPA